ncbi:MAG TPA: PEGA domain-containing protein, partial [Chloroflexota bacterium]|nr:PEGA domain-containing protein [Chloroflexota bacterium]
MQFPFTLIVEPPTWLERRRVGRFWWVGAIGGALIVAGLAVLILASPQPWRQPELSAALDLQTEPDGAVIEVDGRVRGSTPALLALSPGDHHIMLRQDGYADASYDVTLSGGQTTSLRTGLWLVSPEVDELRPPFPGASIASADFLRDGRVALTVAVGTNGDRQAWAVDGRSASLRVGPLTETSGLA